MCKNYKEGLCIANNNKKCLLKEKGAEAKQGECELHGEYNVWVAKDKIIVSNTGKEPDAEAALAYGINFLTADELAYKRSLRLEVQVEYDLKND